MALVCFSSTSAKTISVRGLRLRSSVVFMLHCASGRARQLSVTFIVIAWKKAVAKSSINNLLVRMSVTAVQLPEKQYVDGRQSSPSRTLCFDRHWHRECGRGDVCQDRQHSASAECILHNRRNDLSLH